MSADYEEVRTKLAKASKKLERVENQCTRNDASIEGMKGGMRGTPNGYKTTNNGNGSTEAAKHIMPDTQATKNQRKEREHIDACPLPTLRERNKAPQSGD